MAHCCFKLRSATLVSIVFSALACGSGGSRNTAGSPSDTGGGASVTEGTGGAGGLAVAPGTGGTKTTPTSKPGGTTGTADALPFCPTTPLGFDGSGLINTRFLCGQGSTVMVAAQENVTAPSGTVPRTATLFELQGDKLVPLFTLGGGRASEGKINYIIETMVQSALRLQDGSLVLGLLELRYDQSNTSFGISYSSLIHSTEAASWTMEAGGWEKNGSASSLGQVIQLLQMSDGRVFGLQSAVSGGAVTSVTISERAPTGSWASTYTAPNPSCNIDYPACVMGHSLVEAKDGGFWFTTAKALLGQAPGASTWETRLAATNLAFGIMAPAVDGTLWLTGAEAYVQGNTKQPRTWVGPWDGSAWTAPVAAPLGDSTGSPADIVLTDQGPLAVITTPKPKPMAIVERLAKSQWVPVCQYALRSPPAFLTSCPGHGLFSLTDAGPARIDLP